MAQIITVYNQFQSLINVYIFFLNLCVYLWTQAVVSFACVGVKCGRCLEGPVGGSMNVQCRHFLIWSRGGELGELSISNGCVLSSRGGILFFISL